MAIERLSRNPFRAALAACLAALLAASGLGPLMAGAVVQWARDGNAVTQGLGDDRAPLVVPDGEGGAIIVFHSEAMTLGVQHIDAAGARKWGDDGVPVFSGLTGTVAGFDAISDGQGGVLVVSDESGGRVWGQRIDAAAGYPWGTAGVLMHFGSNDSRYPRMCPDGSGGFLAAWEDRLSPGGDYDVLAQRVTAGGTAALNIVTGGGAYVYAGDGDQTMVQVAEGSCGEAIVAWQDTRGVQPFVYAQCIDTAAAREWDPAGVALGLGGWNERDCYSIAGDGVGGAIVAWEHPGGISDIYAQRISAWGICRWTLGGKPVCTSAGAQWRPQVVCNQAQGAFVAWDDYRQPHADVFAQNLTSNGDPFWARNGFQLTVQPEDQRGVRAAPDGEGGLILAWMDGRDEAEYGVYAQRLNDLGNELWSSTGTRLCSIPNGNCMPAVANTAGGEAVAAWQDTRFAGATGIDIYAQRVLSKGRVLPRAWYFAEGTTRDNFAQYFSIENVNAALSDVRITYMLADGASRAQAVSVPGRSRVTVDVNAFLEAGADNSALVETVNDVPVVVERPMYFNYRGAWTGGHDVMGVTEPREDWYFAEGTTRSAFDQYICLQNPEDTDAEITVTFMLEDSQPTATSLVVEARSRTTLSVRDVLGAGKDNSAHVHSTNGVPVVAERPMYFNYNEAWTGGHCTAGAPYPDSAWYFAEGTTQPGFEQYICIQNPGPDDADVRITYMLAGGVTQTQPVTVPPESRHTVNVKDVLGEGVDNSTLVETTNATDIVVERPMYFNYKGKWTGGHDVVGTGAPRDTWYFAEGTVRSGFEEWLCLQNPNAAPAEALITFLLEDGTSYLETVHLPATSRATVWVNDVIPGEHDVSVRVESADGSNIVAERSMYFNYIGGGGSWTGGSNVLGY